MNYKEQVINIWKDMHNQNWDNLKSYFHKNAMINWHNTNEQFTVEEFVIVNSEYPGEWDIKVERLECVGNLVISVVRLALKDDDAAAHAISFFEFKEDKIILLNEYWGDDGKAPQWRIEKQIGRPINYTEKG